ncbi:MAG: DUF6756 family protein [Acidobacteriota bacterium]
MHRACDDVARSIDELGLTSELVALAADEAKALYAAIERRFSSPQQARWIWEHFRVPGTARRFADDRAYERLKLFVPQAAEQLLFFPGSDEDVKAVYRGGIEAIVAVLGDSTSYEYLIAPPALDWLVCENHHGVVVAIGEPVETRLRSLTDE